MILPLLIAEPGVSIRSKCEGGKASPLQDAQCSPIASRFDKAFVSLFWTAAGMGLPDSVDYKFPDESINFAVVFFFASFILILNWTLLQVFSFRPDPFISLPINSKLY
jgi:hypothetical protein